MEPFKVSAPLKTLTDHYPTALELKTIAQKGGESARTAIARLWLSEGIPYAFKECPAVYEAIRSWLAIKLDIDAKDISMTGSGRLGQSLAPDKIGKVFDSKSDFDLFVISDKLLEKLRADFNLWSFQYESGEITPKNEREASCWKDNYSRGLSLFARGFFDAKLIPNHAQYTCASNIANTMWLLKEKLQITPNAPHISDASIRCYRSWADYTRQVSLNLS